MALGMVRTSIDAFVQQDPKLAIKVCQRMWKWTSWMMNTSKKSWIA